MASRRRGLAPPLIDPDPASVILTTLGVAGSLASLASVPRVTRWMQQRADRRATARDELTGLEGALSELRGYLRSLELQYLAGAPQSRIKHEIGIAFGREQVRFDETGHAQWFATFSKLLQSAVRLQRHMAKLLRIFATSSLSLPEAEGHALEKNIGALNDLMLNLGRTNPEDAFARLNETLGSLTETIRNLRDALK